MATKYKTPYYLLPPPPRHHSDAYWRKRARDASRGAVHKRHPGPSTPSWWKMNPFANPRPRLWTASDETRLRRRERRRRYRRSIMSMNHPHPFANPSGGGGDFSLLLLGGALLLFWPQIKTMLGGASTAGLPPGAVLGSPGQTVPTGYVQMGVSATGQPIFVPQGSLAASSITGQIQSATGTVNAAGGLLASLSNFFGLGSGSSAAISSSGFIPQASNTVWVQPATGSVYVGSLPPSQDGSWREASATEITQIQASGGGSPDISLPSLTLSPVTTDTTLADLTGGTSFNPAIDESVSAGV